MKEEGVDSEDEERQREVVCSEGDALVVLTAEHGSKGEVDCYTWVSERSGHEEG
jgi:hypothetical protein